MTPEPGAATERTRLAWRRTGLAAAVAGLLAVRPAFDPDAGMLAILLAAAAMACWATMIALALRRGRGLDARPPRPARRAIVAYATVTVTFALIGGLVVTL
jgi:drug/metabolite transporter (DMT)-like permease